MARSPMTTRRNGRLVAGGSGLLMLLGLLHLLENLHLQIRTCCLHKDWKSSSMHPQPLCSPCQKTRRCRCLRLRLGWTCRSMPSSRRPLCTAVQQSMYLLQTTWLLLLNLLATWKSPSKDVASSMQLAALGLGVDLGSLHCMVFQHMQF